MFKLNLKNVTLTGCEVSLSVFKKKNVDLQYKAIKVQLDNEKSIDYMSLLWNQKLHETLKNDTNLNILS